VFDKWRFFNYLGYRPHPGQIKVHSSRAARRIVAAGSDGGRRSAPPWRSWSSRWSRAIGER